jgi:hypothetical protein
MTDLITKILNRVILDERVSEGAFYIDNPLHMDALREYMIEKVGIPKELAVEECNRVVAEAGKHPERQAYNKDGILVTFPTPQHKQDAITSGTHFEKDPTKKPPNVFDTPQAAAVDPTGQQPPGDTSTPQPATEPVAQPTPEPTDATADNNGGGDQQTAAQQPQSPAAPSPEPPLTKPDVPETPQEKMATAALIKQILRSDNSVLEGVVEWLVSNPPDHLKDKFKSK